VSVNTETAGGTRYSEGKKRITIAPFLGFQAVMEVAEYGAGKYSDNDWRAGQSWSTLINSTFRHLLKILTDETYDEESGLPHAAHAAWNMCTMCHFIIEGSEGQLDDLWRPHE